jgi:predicted Zn-dependent protease
VKNGKKTRMVSNVTYNAITTDFWGNLDAISGKESWRMFGTGGDAKGQPTQTSSISHGSPHARSSSAPPTRRQSRIGDPKRRLRVDRAGKAFGSGVD